MSERTDADLIREALATLTNATPQDDALDEWERKAFAALDRLVAERDRLAEALRLAYPYAHDAYNNAATPVLKAIVDADMRILSDVLAGTPR